MSPKDRIVQRNVLDKLSLLSSLLIMFYVFYPLLLPLVNNKLEFIYGDFSSRIGTNSAFDFLRQVYYVLNERIDCVDFSTIRHLIMGSALSLVSTVFALTESQVLSAAIAISLILGTYGIYKLVTLFETSPSRRAVLLPALTAFYFLNLWSIERITHIWIWLMYAVLPLYLYLGLSYAYSGGINRLIAYSLLLSAYGIIPHNLIYMTILHIFLVIYIMLLFNYKKALTFATTPLAIHTLTNIPIFIVLFSTGNTSYPVRISLDVLYMLSRNGNLINFFTFTNNWWPQVPSDLLKSPIFRTSSIFLFLVATAMAIIARRERKTRLIIHLAYAFILLVAFVAQGTNNHLITTSLERLGKLGMLDLVGPFREWARISVIVPSLLTIIVAVSIASIKRGKDILLALFSLLTMVNIVSSPSFIYIYQVWAPAHVPSEYYTLSKEVSPLYKTLWIYPSKATEILGTWRYIWNEQKALGNNLEMSVGSTYNICQLQYAKMLTLVEAPPQLLTALNAKYVILRTDILGAAGFRANYTYLQCQKLTYLTVCQNPHNATSVYVAQTVVTADLDGEGLYAIFAEAAPRTAVVPQLTSETTMVVHNYKSAWLYQELKRRGYIVAPLRFLYTHNPYRYWSLAYTSDPLHAGWHPYLAEVGLENWQSDYGEGLAFTMAQGARMDIPFSVGQPGEYVLLARVFENSKGGLLRMYIDGAPAAEINTASQLNRFVWKALDVYWLEPGKHVLTLENVYGFNAVNVFALVPVDEYVKLVSEYEKLLENKTVVYLFEAEFDMFRDKAKITSNIDASNGKWLLLNIGGSAWQSFEVVRDGYYMLAVRLKGSTVVELDDRVFNVSSRGLGFAYVGPVYLSRGVHRLVVKPVTETVASWVFTDEDIVEAWKRYTLEKQFGAVHEVVWDPGERALRVELYNSTGGWKTIGSPLIPIEPWHAYVFRFKIKAVNGHVVHFKVVEYDENGKIVHATYAGSIGDGSFDWRDIEYVYMPRNESVVYLQLQVWHGHLTNKPLPNVIWIKDVEVYKYDPVYLDVVWIYSVNSPSSKSSVEDLFKVEEEPAKVIKYERLDPTLWKAEVVANKPFLLVFAVSYDPLWEARVYKDGKLIERVRSIPVNGVINGFLINETGNLAIVIRFVPQDWFELGLRISVVTFTLCIFYLIWDWRRSKGDKWAIRLERSIRSMNLISESVGKKVIKGI